MSYAREERLHEQADERMRLNEERARDAARYSEGPFVDGGECKVFELTPDGVVKWEPAAK